MIGYSEREIFSPAEVLLLHRAERLVRLVPYLEPGTTAPLRCHELARAVGAVLNLNVCDGRFGFVEHSWLWMEPRVSDHAWSTPNILDVYVPGGLPSVQLVDGTHTGLPKRYLPDSKREDVRLDVVKSLLDLFERKETLCS